MSFDKVIITNARALAAKHQNAHAGYEYFKKSVLSGEAGNKCNVSVYEIPPGKSAYPYHYHALGEEVFYILSGQGLLKTPEGERPICAGDFLFFPDNPSGAHKLTNTSATEMLTYIDFDTCHDVNVAFYPDSNKVGVWGQGFEKLFHAGEDAAYYDGE
jgi:uncharacterized cupin superfamily protein